MVKPGSGARAERGQKATISYTGIYEGQQFDKKEEYSFVLGEEDSLQGQKKKKIFPSKEKKPGSWLMN